MPFGLKRYQTSGHDHAINFCCYKHLPYLGSPASRYLFERALENARRKYQFEIYAYVVMPDHVHLLVSEPPIESLSKAIQALKLSVSKQSPQRPFWQDRYYDFNVITQQSFLDKRKYIHRNPVRAGLVESPEDWPHSSYLTYLSQSQTTVFITMR
ncbi:MAG: transposase [Acidobacteria bacterium]|nr:transposase [Acidobacteriota bacterium]